MNLIILESDEVGDSGEVTLSGPRAAHLLNVLQVTPGHPVRVGLLDGPCGVGAVQSIGDGSVAMRCTFEVGVPSRPRVDLLLALPRPKVMRRIWAQIAALGIGQIILTNAERVERNYFDTSVLTPECYRPLLIEGLQQARDTRLPNVSIHRQFKVLIEDKLDGLFRSGLRLVADPAAEKPVGAAVRERIEGRTLLAVGPEGAGTISRGAFLRRTVFILSEWDPRTLRTDTACIALLALVHEAMR